MALFLLLVAIGLPLLSGGRGGLGVFMGPSAGYLFGWIISAFAIGILTERRWNRIGFVESTLYCVLGGIILLYALGIPVTAMVAKLSLWDSAAASMVFVPGDLVKAVVASLVIVTVKRSFPLINVRA